MSGWAYLATVIDGYSRRVVGWSVADHMREELVIDAFRMAVANRRPGPGRWFSIPTAEASTPAARSVMYASVMVSYRQSGRLAFASTMRRRSRGTRQFKKELIHLHAWMNVEHVRQASFEFAEVYTIVRGYRRDWGI